MPNQTFTQHPEFYIRGGDLHFQVDRTLFRVYSYFFLRESVYWKNQLLPGPNVHEAEPLKKGGTSSNPIIIVDEKPEDFARFLWVVYNPKYGDYSKPKCAHWITILRLAAQWKFPEVKELALSHVEKFDMSPINRTQLYIACAVPEKYLFPLYLQLAAREESLGLDEARALGLETFVSLLQARERLRAQNTIKAQPTLSPIRADLKNKDLIEIVASTFKISLDDLDLSDLDASTFI